MSPGLPNSISIKNLLRQLNSEFSSLDAMPPETLYHYTDPGGLLGILNSKKLWFSRMGFLNDTTEATHGSSLVQEALKARLNLGNMFSATGSILKITSSFFDEFLPKNITPFITCFCANGDLLSQWRGYGSRGGGFAIGFRAQELAARIETKARKSTLIKVIYDETKQRAHINAAVDAFCTLSDTIGKESPQADTSQFITDATMGLCAALVDVCYRFKHPGFSEEAEWRLVVFEKTSHPELEFRSTGSRIIPYFSINMCKSAAHTESLPISKIICGPTMNQELTQQALALRLAQDPGLKDVKIEASHVPFRS